MSEPLDNVIEALALARDYKSDNKKLREENAELKKLLKAAVEDLRFESQCRNCKYKETGLDTVCRGCRGNKWEWHYEVEVLALIGKDGDNS